MNPEGLLAVVTDEGTMRALESDQRLAAHLRALSRLSPTMAHDVRTPLHTVILYLELLRNTLAEKPGGDATERQGGYVGVIGSELQRLEGMLDSLLAQLRVAEDTVERLNLVEIVGDLHALLEPYRRRGRGQLRLTSPAAPVTVQGNRDSLKQALLHILITSVEAVPAESEVALSVSAERDEAVVRLAGALPSIPPQLQGGGVDSAPAFGAERGLHAARRVVERHGGSIHVRSGARGAATLEIHLPLAAAETG